MIKGPVKKIKNICIEYFDSPTKAAINSLPNRGAVHLIDIGAAGEIEPRWKPYRKNISYVGFEPDKRSRDIILNRKTDFINYEIFPFSLSDSTKKVKFNLCRKPQVSSLYEPNMNFLNRFPDAKRFDVLDQLNFETVTLDSVGLKDLDFIKIDIQGAENDVLKGASDALELSFGLELEVEFIDMYLKQPIFGDVCKQLSTKGYEFFDFVHLERWERHSHFGFGQCVFGDALFLKTPETIDLHLLDIKKISAYISILLIYRKFDLIQKTLDLLDQDRRDEFKGFEDAFVKVKNRNTLVRKIFSLMNRIIHFFGHSYRLHLIH